MDTIAVKTYTTFFRDRKDGRLKMEGKKLYKSEENRIICGVCGGLGEYFGLDPVIIRLIFVALTFVWGGGVLLYLVAAIIMPRR